MQTSENNRAGELKDLGWSPEDVRKYEELWEYRQRWGAINLEREDRLFLRKAEAALPKLSSGRGSEKKRLQDKSHYRWLSFYLEAMQASPAETGLAAGERGAWPVLLEQELRALDHYEPVLGLPDTLKAKELLPIREQLIQQAAAGAAVLEFDFVAPLEALKRQIARDQQRARTFFAECPRASETSDTLPLASAPLAREAAIPDTSDGPRAAGCDDDGHP